MYGWNYQWFSPKIRRPSKNHLWVVSGWCLYDFRWDNISGPHSILRRSFFNFKMKYHHFSCGWVHCVNGPSSVVSTSSSTVKLRLDVSRTRRLTVRCSSNARWFGRGPSFGISLLLSFASLGFLSFELWALIKFNNPSKASLTCTNTMTACHNFFRIIWTYVFAWFASFFFECPLSWW